MKAHLHIIFPLVLLLFSSEAHTAISSFNVSVPEELEPGEQFNVTYYLSGSSTLAVAEIRFYLWNPSYGSFLSPESTFGPLNESFQLPLNGSFPSYGPPAGLQTRFITMPTSLGSFSCFPSGTWRFVVRVDLSPQSSDTFSVAPLSISSFTPQSGPPCTSVTVNGNKFFDATNILFNGVFTGGSIINDTTITTTVPPGATTGPIQLVNSCGGNPNAFSISPFYVTPIINPTTISGFTPSTAPVDAPVQIFGQNFTANTGVYFNGTPAARNIINSQTIEAFVPAGAKDGPITVGTGCEGLAESSTAFVVDPYCYSSAFFIEDSRIDSVRLGPLEYVNPDPSGCANYTDNTNLKRYVFPGQTGIPIEIGQGSCGINYLKTTKLFIDWNRDNDFADTGEEVLVGPLAGNGVYFDAFDIPPTAPLGATRMRVVTAELSPSDVNACGLFGYGETQDYTIEIAPCAATRDLPPDLWHMISLACDPGSANTVQDLFADDMTGIYSDDWGLFEFNALTGQYVLLDLDDTVQPGQGYWLKTLNQGQSIGPGGVNPLAFGVHGLQNPVIDTALVADPTEGRSNLVGFPFTFDVDWVDVQIVDGGSVLTLDEADPLIGADRACDLEPPHASCVMSRIFYRWNGSAYETFDGVTPGAEGVLTPLDGLWVKAYKSGISLRIPATPSSNIARSRPSTDGWFIRLIAESNDLRDSGNVLGTLSESSNGYDLHDLRELPPFGDPYLTIVFPHPEWEDQAGDYTTDFRTLNLDENAPPSRWRFEVRSSDPTATVTLSWDADTPLLRRSELIDEETGDLVPIHPGESFSFNMSGPSRSFQWSVQGGEMDSADQIFSDGFESGDMSAWEID